MSAKTDEARNSSSKNMKKRTEVKDLPKLEEPLDQKVMKKVKGSVIGPCDRDRRNR